MPLFHLPELPGHGLMYNDEEALSCFQRQCLKPLLTTMELENEAYLGQHPEIAALFAMFMAKIIGKKDKPHNRIKTAVEYFTRPLEEIEADIRTFLKLSADEPYAKENPGLFQHYKDLLLQDLLSIIKEPQLSEKFSEEHSSQQTASSSFISVISSATTVSTPVPTPPLEPTFSEILHDTILLNVDKALFAKLDVYQIYYDSAYMAVMNLVENAMEIAVRGVKADIVTLYAEAYNNFESIIQEKERKALELAWEKRMRKKWKKLFKLKKNYRGYETPPTEPVSVDECYRMTPRHHFVIHPHCTFNRYPKDNFGIYLPQEQQYSCKTVTITPDPSTATPSEYKSSSSTSSKAMNSTIFSSDASEFKENNRFINTFDED